MRALGVEDDLLDEGLAELAAVVEGCAAGEHRQVTVEANLRIARGLDYYTGTVFEIFMTGYERLKSVGGGGRYDAPGERRPHDVPGRSASSFGVSRTLVPLMADGVLAGSRAVPSAVLVALADEESPSRRPTPSPTVCAAAASRPRSPPHPQKFGKQIRYAERRGIPYVWFPGTRRRSRTRSRTSAAATRSTPTRRLDAARGRPAPAHRHHPSHHPRHHPSHHRGAATVIRTHDAGSLRAEHVGQTVTLAGWVARRRDHGGVAFIDLREASGVVQVVIRDEAVAHQLRAEYCLKITGEVSARPEGNQNADLPTGEIEVIAHRRPRGAQRQPRRCPSRSTSTSRWGRRSGSRTATSTCAAPAPPPRSGCAARSTGPPATCSPGTTSSRSRRRR